VPPWRRVLLPLAAWLTLSRSGWLAGVWPGAEARAAVVARAGEAAAWLAGLATRDGAVIAVTHGAVRPVIAAALHASGWRGRAWGRYAPWSAWEFTASSGDSVAAPDNHAA
jgi:broad specificity phosphatase PhoE